MELTTCPHCHVHVLPSADGECPSCRRRIAATARKESFYLGVDDRIGIMPMAITGAVCLLAAGSTFAMFAIVMVNNNPGNWKAVAMLGGWDSLVYFAAIALAIHFRSSRHAASILVVGVTAIASFSVFVLYTYLSSYFTPPVSNARVMNCAGPVVELGLPFLQWPALGLIVAVAYFASHNDIPTYRSTQYHTSRGV